MVVERNNLRSTRRGGEATKGFEWIRSVGKIENEEKKDEEEDEEEEEIKEEEEEEEEADWGRWRGSRRRLRKVIWK